MRKCEYVFPEETATNSMKGAFVQILLSDQCGIIIGLMMFCPKAIPNKIC
jgi:hypothetical protein